MRVAGYDYNALLTTVFARDEGKCFGRELLVARRRAQVDAWGAGQGEVGDAEKNWIPKGLLECRLPWDAHHWLEKSWLKDWWRTRVREVRDNGWGGEEAEWITGDLAATLNDPRNVSLACRRHHDLIGNRLVVVRRSDLPPEVEEFARELGDRAVARLERDFGRAPVSPVELRTGG
jgi:hypothetical protein